MTERFLPPVMTARMRPKRGAAAAAAATPAPHSHQSHWTGSWRPGNTLRSCWTRTQPGQLRRRPPLPDRGAPSPGGLWASARCFVAPVVGSFGPETVSDLGELYEPVVSGPPLHLG